MIDWLDFESGFAALLQTLSGVPANVVNSKDNGVNFTFPAGAPYPEAGSEDEGQVKIDFAIISEATWGRDELRQSYDPTAVIPGDTYSGPGAPLGGVVYAVNGNRELVIQVACDRYNVSQPAFETLRNIRDRLWLPSTRAACKALGIAVSKSGPILRIDAELDGRSVSRYTFEITANVMANASDAPVTTIETVNVDTSEIIQ